MGDAEAAIAERYRLMSGQLNERQRRWLAATEARTFGRGGIAAAARACGMSETTVRKGLSELDDPEPLEAGRVRKPGAGRKRAEDADPKLLDDLRTLVEGDARGDPERVLLWTAKSLRTLAAELSARGHQVGKDAVAGLLKTRLGFSLQSARKTLEGKQHPDRDAQFQHINDTVAGAIAAGQPAISIDTKKKELVGEFINRGREWHPAGQAPKVNTYDFPTLAKGKAIPYGIYDIAENTGFVSVGIDRDTAQFSVAAIDAWWHQLGHKRHPDARRLVITADCGGSNGNRTRLWKTELQRLAGQDRPGDLRLSLPARDQQVEQDRAPPVQLHLQELARSAAGLLPGHHQPDRRHHNERRPGRLHPPGRPQPPQGPGHRRAARRRQHRPPHLPRRVELHHQAIT